MIKSNKQLLYITIFLVIMTFIFGNVYTANAVTTSGFVGEATISANGYPEIVISGTNNYNYAKFLGDYKTAVNKDEYFPNENLSDIYLHPIYGSQHPISEDARNHFRGSNPELFFDIK